MSTLARRHAHACLLTALIALALVAFATAPAAAAPILGIGDQKAESFQHPLFQQLGVKRTRLFTPYDSIFRDPARLDAWIRAAQAAGLEPQIAFEKPASMTCPGRGCRPVSPAAFEGAFRAFRAKYPELRIISPWNEANSGTQPTGRNPRSAAWYNNIVRRHCRNCRIIAADVLDIANMRSWVRTFQRYARGNPRLRIWGLHNYGDVNRFRTSGTRTLLRETRGKIWLTETGGLVTFRTADGRTAFPTSEARAARAMNYLLSRLRRLGGSRIQRIYLYNWQPLASGSDRFDAGLVRPDGSPREMYRIVQRYRSLIR
jgi:hypothetical protein